MRLKDLYKSKRLDISIELFPPKTPEGRQKLFEKIEHLCRLNPAFFSMTYGAGGNTARDTVELVDYLKNKVGVETMCHLTVLHQARAHVLSVLDRLQEIGVYNLIALRGDPPRDGSADPQIQDSYGYALELVREAKARKYFSIAVAGFPEIHPDSPDRETDIRYLKEKVEAGADVIITQLFFDNDYFYEYVDHVRRARIRVPIIPGILPILSVGQVRRFTALCKAKIPDSVQKELSKYENDDDSARAYGIELATRQCEGLFRHGVPGIHFYALNQSQSVEAVLENLNLIKKAS